MTIKLVYRLFDCSFVQKSFSFKKRDTSKLKIKLRKGQKKVFKKLVKANKGCSFAPAMTQTFFKRLASKTNWSRKFIFKKRFKKACENRKRMLHLHPAKRAKFLDRLIRKSEEKEIQYFLKKLQNFLAS